MFDQIKNGLWWDRALTLVEGCTPVSPGCDNCWSAAMNYRFHKTYQNGIGMTEFLTTDDGKFKGVIVCRDDRLELPLKVKKPTVWAVWNDLFHEDVPYSFVMDDFQMFDGCPHHIFIVLTKRPERLLKLIMTEAGSALQYVHGPKNVWIGVTAENQEMADLRLPILLQIPAAVHFVSVEPMLGPVNLRPGLPRKPKLSLSIGTQNSKALDWVICGCESGPRRRPTEWTWIQSLKDQCKAASVPFFLKQGELGRKVVKAPYPEYLEIPR